MLVEIALRLIHLFTVNQAGMAYAAVGEGIDNRTSEPHGKEIVDKRPHNGPGCCNQHYEEYIHVTFGYSQISSRRHHHFRRERKEGTLNHHEQEHKPIARVFNKQIKQVVRTCIIRYGKGAH